LVATHIIELTVEVEDGTSDERLRQVELWLGEQLASLEQRLQATYPDMRLTDDWK
jgi:hypothetical protein